MEFRRLLFRSMLRLAGCKVQAPRSWPAPPSGPGPCIRPAGAFFGAIWRAGGCSDLSPEASAGRPVAASPGSAHLGLGELVVQQSVQLGGLGAGAAEAAADSLDGDAGVDQLGGVGVAKLVDVDNQPGDRAVALP